jgi:ribosomal protein S27AE|tara:strand:- start:17557 stop:18021 length:465 start_codon:yes stop_codon:yes gene_type:complete
MVTPTSLEFNMIRSKKCFKCKAVKQLEDFYKHPQMPDGRVNKCKECNKKDVTANREKNIERIREYDRERGKNKERMLANVETTRAWRAEDKRRTVAHNAVARAIRSGALERIPCIRCGEAKSLAHHEDYDKPLGVIWLCQPCHKQRHKELLGTF